MKNELEHLESPFLSETIQAGPADDEPHGVQALYEADTSYETEAPDHHHEHEHGEDHECPGCRHDAWLAQDEAGAEDESPGCGGDHEFPDLEAEWFDREAWSGSAEQLAFRDRVLEAHLARSRRSRGAPQRDLVAKERDVVPGTRGLEMQRDAAAAAGRLLAAANTALAQAQQAGDADALRTVRLSATSGYRPSDHQRRLWLQYFPGYYKRTQAAREQLPAGPHSDAAVDYMLRPTSAGGFGLGGRIAAPGYSNHQNGIAIDLWQERKKGHAIANSSGDAARRKWRASWFHGWLKANAAGHGFQPLATEEWHWEYRGGVSATQGAPATAATPPARAPAAASSTQPGTVPPAPADHLGGQLWTFTARVLRTPVAVFCPPAARSRSEVDVLVYAHGLLNGCPRPASLPGGMITSAPFKLGALVAKANRPIVLVVPLLDWSRPGGAQAFGAGRPRWHALAKPAHLNALVAEVLAELGRVQAAAAPTLRRLVVAGHSRAYDFLEPLAHLHTDPQMQQGALARLSEVWSFDATYAGNVPRWQAWLAANPQLRASIFYRAGSKTAAVGKRFLDVQGGRLSVTRVAEGHCDVPARQLPALLAGGTATTHQETQDTWGDDEAALDGLQADDEHLYGAQDEADAIAADDEVVLAEDLTDGAYEGNEAYETDAGGDEQAAFEVDAEAEPEADPQADAWLQEAGPEFEDAADEFEAPSPDDDETAIDEQDEFEFEDEDHAEQALEEDEAAGRSPMAVPADNPVPFAPLPPPGSHWPVRTSHPSARLVSYMYQAPSGIVGRAGRMFLAGRKGTNQGRTVLRWHAGVDLFAHVNDVVVACEAGTLVDFSFFYQARSGQRTYKLLVEHEGSGIVINYGELRGDSLSGNGLEVGMRVGAGQPIGWVSDTSMLHFETYVKGTTRSHRWWKADKNPPRELLNPTRYLLELARSGATPSTSAGKPPASSTGATAAEAVRFAQRVLNAGEGERLATDGDLGPQTRAALARFRQFRSLGPGGVLDAATLLALAQRALEELAQQSMFPQPGVMDARTRDALSAFRLQRGLGHDAKLDAATRLALADALAQRQAAPGTAPQAPARAAPAPSGPLPSLGPLGQGHTPPADPGAYRKFRLTTYHVVDQNDVPTGAVRIPIYDEQGRKLAEGSPAFFGQISLEGTGRLTDGRLINVTGKKVAVRHDEYAEVLAYHERAYAGANRKRAAQGKSATPTQYSGIDVAGGRVVRAFAFHEVAAARRGVGYGMARGVPHTPFRTLAADIGHIKYGKVDPDWKGKGGLVPPGTHVYIKEYDGLKLPDGSTHDGWFVVNDTGGAIFGAHFDVFTGSAALRRQATLPAFGQVWFPGIEQRIPVGYTYGLEK